MTVSRATSRCAATLLACTAMLVIGAPGARAQGAPDNGKTEFEIYGFAMLDMGYQFVKNDALFHLLVLLEGHAASERKELLDDLNPLRRFEAVCPGLQVFPAAAVRGCAAVRRHVVRRASTPAPTSRSSPPTSARAICGRTVSRTASRRSLPSTSIGCRRIPMATTGCS